jgi:hypothetical protein
LIQFFPQPTMSILSHSPVWHRNVDRKFVTKRTTNGNKIPRISFFSCFVKSLRGIQINMQTNT